MEVYFHVWSDLVVCSLAYEKWMRFGYEFQ